MWSHVGLLRYLEELESKDDRAGNRSRQSVDREERAKQLAMFESCKERIAKLEQMPVDEGLMEWFKLSGRPLDDSLLRNVLSFSGNYELVMLLKERCSVW